LTLTVVPDEGVRVVIDVNVATSYGRDALAAWSRGDVTGGRL
jgi:phage head maturation protease